MRYYWIGVPINIYARAKEPKKILLYPGCRRGLDECQDQVDKDVVEWLRAQFEAGKPAEL